MDVLRTPDERFSDLSTEILCASASAVKKRRNHA
jgi:hypothetical protein